MTAERRFGEDTPFGSWARKHDDLESHQFGLTLNDADWIFHRFALKDGTTRLKNVQFLMLLEVKTREAEPNPSQAETLFFLHQMLQWKGEVRRPQNTNVTLWSYGVSVLSMNGEFPGDPRFEKGMQWGRFMENGELKWVPVEESELVQLLRFALNPDTFTPLSFRSHHLKREYEIIEDRGLLKIPITKVKRS